MLKALTPLIDRPPVLFYVTVLICIYTPLCDPAQPGLAVQSALRRVLNVLNRLSNQIQAVLFFRGHEYSNSARRIRRIRRGRRKSAR